MVVKIGGAGVDHPLGATALWRAVVRAHEVLDGRLILVHGGGRAVDAHLQRLGYTVERREGLRVTPEGQVDEVMAVLAGRVNKGIVGAINTLRERREVRAVGLCLGDGWIVGTSRKLVGPGVDLGRVGEVVYDRQHDNPEHLLNVLLSSRFLPVLCSIGFGHDGRPLNVNADEAAAAIACLMNARSLVLLTDAAGVLDERGAPIARLTPAEIRRLEARGVITAGMVPKVRAAATAATHARAPTFIASWAHPEDLVRLARGEPVGTEVRPDS